MWAELILKLNKRPCAQTIRRIISDTSNIEAMAKSIDGNRKKSFSFVDIEIEHDMCPWINEIWAQGINISDALIQQKARQVSGIDNDGDISRKKYGRNYSNGWLESFKKRTFLKCHRSHGSSGEADKEAVEM